MDCPVIMLPAQFRGLTLSKLARDVVNGCPEWPPKELAFNFSQLVFIRPAGVVFLSNLLSWLDHQGAKVSLVGLARRSAALEYLDNSLFFQQHCGRKLSDAATPRATTRPLVKIAHEYCHSWLQARLVPWLAGRLGLTESSLLDFKTCVSELFNNIQDHSRFDIGSIFVQHFPSENTVTISLSDFGIGIPAKVREKVPNLSDSEAVLLAVTEGFTSKSIPGKVRGYRICSTRLSWKTVEASQFIQGRLS